MPRPTTARERITLTLSSASLEELRKLVGARGLSAAVDQAVAAYLERLRHFTAVDDWLAEMERGHGAIPSQTEWAAKLVAEWESDRGKRSRRIG